MGGSENVSKTSSPNGSTPATVQGQKRDHLLLHSILEATHDAFFLIDTQFNLLTFNRSFSELVRTFSNKVPAVNMDIFELLTSYNREFLTTSFKRVLQGEFIEMETMLTTDPPQWTHVHFYPIQETPDAEIEGITVCLRDITTRKLAEEHAGINLQKYRTLIENGPDANYQFNLVHYKFEYFSPVIESISGFTSEEISSWDHAASLDFIHPEDRNSFLEAQKQSLQTGKISAEYRCRKKDGTYIWVSNRASVLVNEKGDPVSMIGSIRDIDLQKKADLLLLKSEEEYRALIENSLDATYHFDFTRNQFFYVSPVMEKISGFTVAEIRSWAPEENIAHCHPEDLNRLTAEMGRSLKTGKLEVEYRSLRKDGKYIWVSNTANIIRDTKGNPVLSIGSIRDISNKKETEAALIKSESQYRTLVEHASEGILILNAEGELIEANSQLYEQLGYSKQELAEKNLMKLLQIDPTEPPLRLAEVLAGFRVVQERKALKSDGTFLNVELSCKLLPDFRILVIVRDLSERNRSRRIIEEKDNTFQQLFHFSGEGFFMADCKGYLTDVNEAGCQLLGYRKKDILNRNFQDFIERDPGQNLLDLESLTAGNSMLFTRKAKNSEGVLRVLEINAIRLADNRLLGITHDITEKRNEHKRISQSEEKFRTLFENSMEGIILNDDAGNIIAANPAACRLFGRTEEELRSITRNELSPDDADGRNAILMERRSKGTASGEITYNRKDGSQFRATVNSSEFIGVNNQKMVAVNIHDISERLRSEKVLRESESLFRKMFDVATVGAVVVNPQGKYLEVNDAYCKMLGYSRNELLKMSFLDITYPDDFKFSAESFRNLFNRSVDNFTIEKRYIHKNGKTIWVLLSSTVLKTENGKAETAITHFVDITERKEAQAALEASQTRYKTMFDKASFGIAIMSANGKLIALNESYASLHGYTVEEILKLDLGEINIPESRALLSERIKQVLTGETLQFEAGHYHKNGQILTFDITATAIKIGHETFIQSFLRDITELKKISEEAKANERKYTTLFEKASIGISFIGEDRKLINVNEAYAAMHGYTVEEILEMDVYQLNTPDSGKSLGLIADRIFSGETLQYEAEHYHKAGHIITVEITTSLVRIGEHKFIQSFLRDITELKNARLDANESENRYRNLFEESSFGIIFVGENGTILNVNQAGAGMHGYTIEEMLSLNVQDLLPEEDKVLFDSRIGDLMSGKQITFQVRHRHKNGSYRSLEVHGKVHRFKDQSYVQCFIRDITDIIRAENALTESESRYKSIFESASTGITIISMQGIIINTNKAFANMHGYEVSELINASIRVLNAPETEALIFPILSLVSHERSERIEVPHVSKTGETRYYDVSVNLIKHGNEDCYLAFYHDITESKANREELILKENAIASSISGMGMTDLQGNIIYANNALCQMWGARDTKTLIGRNLLQVFEGNRIHETVHALQTKGFDQGEDVGKRLDGTLFPVEFSANVLLDDHGKPVCMFGSFLDISERKKAEERLRKKFTQISALAELSEVIGKTRKMEDVFKITAEAVHKTIGADKVAILLTDGQDTLNYAYSLNISDDYKKILERHSARSIIDSDMMPKLIPDVEQEEMVKKNLPMIRKEGIRSIGFFPLVHQEKLLGKLIVYYTESHHFSVGELHLAETIGRDVAFSIHEKREQLKLLSEKEFSDSIINSLPGIFFVWDKELKILRWNKHFEEVSGYLHEEIAGMNPITFVAPEDRDLIISRIRDAFSRGSARSEANLLTKDGRNIPYYFSAVVVNLNGEYCIVGNGIDISERKKTERALIDSELRYRSLINQANDLIILSDDQTTILEVNEIVSSMLGYNKEAVLGKSTLDFFAENELDHLPSQLNNILAGKSILIERKVKHKNGTLVDVELNSKMLPDGKILTFARDIRERKNTETALINERNLSESTINNLPGIFYLFDETGTIIRWNRNFETISGYTAKEIPKMKILDFYEEEMHKQILAAIKKGFRKVQPGLEVQVMTKKKVTIPFLFISKPIKYEGKNCIIGIGMDISHQKKTEEDLLKSYSQIRQLTEHLQIVREEERAYLAREVHDVLGQQLTVLKMDMAWLNTTLKDKDRDFAERLKGMDEMMDETIKTVRQISTDLRSGVLDNFGFSAAIEWQCVEFRKKTGIHVIFQNEAEGLNIPQKQSMGLFRIFQESLTNIARHAKATRVDVLLTRKNGGLHMKITDNGKGFSTRKVIEKKTLGLIGMQERTRIINGTIRITGKTGVGTTIDVMIPENELTEH